MAAVQTTAQSPGNGPPAAVFEPLTQSARAQQCAPIARVVAFSLFVAWAAGSVCGCGERERSARLDAQELGLAIELFVIEERGSLPETLTVLAPKYMKSMRRDPWGGDYRYQHSGTTYLVWSAGPDQLYGTPDDVVKQGDVARLADHKLKN